MAYNDIYERLVDRDPNSVRGYIAYGLYKNAKREWIKQETARAGAAPTSEMIAAYAASYTPVIIEGLRSQADSALAAFADEAINDAKPGIVETALKGSTWGALGTGLLTNFIYTLLLLTVVWMLARAGVDILDVAQTNPSPAEAASQPTRADKR